MLRNRGQVTSWKEHLIVTRETPGWLKHAAAGVQQGSRLSINYNLCTVARGGLQSCLHLLVSALTWRQWGFFLCVEATLKSKQGKSRWPRIGNSWLWCGSLTARMQPVDLCVACQQCFVLPSSMDASDLSINWLLLSVSVVVECAFPFDVLLPWELYFCPTNGKVQSAEVWKLKPLRYKNRFPALKDVPWVWLNSTTLWDSCAASFYFKGPVFNM